MTAQALKKEESKEPYLIVRTNIIDLIANDDFDALSIPDRQDRILEFERALAALPGAYGEDPFPLLHHHAPGMYIREIFIPKYKFLTGKIHKHDHFMVFLGGDAVIVSQYGRERINKPCVRLSKAGSKRVVFTFEDTHIITTHVSDTDDLEEIEESHMARNFSEVNS